MEIFDKWWEYFIVMWWGLKPPKSNVIIEDNRKEHSEFKTEYYAKLNAMSSTDLDIFEKILDNKSRLAVEHRRVIEEKAQSMISQSGIAASLMAIVVSVFAIASIGWSILLVLVAYILLILPIINIIAAILLARNTLVLKYGYPEETIPDTGSVTLKIDSIIDKIYIVDHSSYFNRIKASYLKFAHWYYKATFICLLLIVLIFPLLFLGYSGSSKGISMYNKIKNKFNTYKIEMLQSEDSPNVSTEPKK